MTSFGYKNKNILHIFSNRIVRKICLSNHITFIYTLISLEESKKPLSVKLSKIVYFRCLCQRKNQIILYTHSRITKPYKTLQIQDDDRYIFICYDYQKNFLPILISLFLIKIKDDVFFFM